MEDTWLFSLHTVLLCANAVLFCYHTNSMGIGKKTISCSFPPVFHVPVMRTRNAVVNKLVCLTRCFLIVPAESHGEIGSQHRHCWRLRIQTTNFFCGTRQMALNVRLKLVHNAHKATVNPHIDEATLQVVLRTVWNGYYYFGGIAW